MSFSAEKIKAFRFLRSGLLTPFPDAETCAARLLGIQAQIFTAGSLSIAARTPLASHADLLRTFSGERRLIKTWGQRSTVHLYTATQFPLMAAAFSQEASWMKKKFLKGGGTEAKFYSLVEEAADFLRSQPACSRPEMVEFLQAREGGSLLVGSWGGILVDLGRRGHLCLGGYDAAAKTQLLYAIDRWTGNAAVSDLDFDAANTEVMRAYFRHYGPATFKDFCHWRGVSQTLARPWLAALRPALAVIPSAEGDMFLPKADMPALEDLAATAADLPSRLLYRFDPMVLAHKDKTWLVEARDYKQVWRKAAHVEGVILKAGMAVGVWKFQRKGQRVRFLISNFRSRNKLGKRELKAQLQRIAAYLGYGEWEYVEEKF